MATRHLCFFLLLNAIEKRILPDERKMVDNGGLALKLSSSTFSEERSKEEKGLLRSSSSGEDTDDSPNNDESHKSVTPATFHGKSATKRLLLPFLAGFLSNLMPVMLWFLWRGDTDTRRTGSSSGKEQSSSTPVSPQPPSEILRHPMFLNDTHAFGFLLDSQGGSPFAYSADYFWLQQGFEAQVNQAYCGVATVTTVMNSFSTSDLALPIDYDYYDPYPYATQNDVFSDCVTNTVVYTDDDFDGIFAIPFGLGMGQVEALMKCFFPAAAAGANKRHWRVTATHVDPSLVTVDQTRQDLMDLLQSAGARAIVNFDRSLVYEEGGGHWSPVAAYSVVMDAFLILDVAKYKYPATWVPTITLHNAMATVDECGTWDFPHAQAKLSDEFLYPDNSKRYQKAMELLGCKDTYRGYVGLRRT